MRVSIIGLGLIGGSLGLALRAAGSGYEVVGHNRHHEAAGHALKIGAIDRAEWNLPRALEGADIVVVAVAPRAIATVFRDIAPYLGPGTIVTDVASTKSDVMRWAEELLPSGIDFVGGHPMAGKETAGIASADERLFRHSTYCVVAGERSSARSVDAIAAMAAVIGARPYFIDAAEHDSYVAGISHVPFIAAASLVTTVADEPSWRDMGRLAAGGFRDGTRTASADVAMHTDICLTNREAIGRRLDDLITTLAGVRDAVVEGDEEQLRAFFGRAKVARDAWLADRAVPPDAVDAPPLPPKPGLSELLLGTLPRRNRSSHRP